MATTRWIIVVLIAVLLADTGGAAPTVAVVPDTVDSGAQPAHWAVTVTDLPPLDRDSAFHVVYWSTDKPVFVRHPATTPAIHIGGCEATVSSALHTTLMLSLAKGCGLGGTFSFTLPGAYLAANPGGNVSVLFSIGASRLRTVIAYTPDSPSPSHSPRASARPSPSPAHSPRPSPLPQRTPTVAVVPDTVDSGAQPAHWAVTVTDLPPLDRDSAFHVVYWSTDKPVFVRRPATTPAIHIGGCEAAVSSALRTTLMLSLAKGCGLGGTFDFTLPGAYLAANPGGNVSVMFSIGASSLRTVIAYTPDSPSPSHSPRPAPHPSPRPSPISKPAVAVVPATVDSGAQPAHWAVTVTDLPPLDRDSAFHVVYWSTDKPVFVRRPATTPAIHIGGCEATVSSALRTTLMLSLAKGCGLGGTFDFTLPGAYLAANPGGNVSVLFSIGASSLRTVIAYTPDSPSPSPSATHSSADPSSTTAPATLAVTPDTVAEGAQARQWTVTLSHLAPVAPRALQYIYLSTCCLGRLFVATPSAKPFGVVGHCSTTATATTTALLVHLPDDCALSGSVAFVVPAAFLAPHPGGNVSVHFSLGSNDLWTTVEYPAAGSTLRTPSTPSKDPWPTSLPGFPGSPALFPEESTAVGPRPTLLLSTLASALLCLLLAAAA